MTPKEIGDLLRKVRFGRKSTMIEWSAAFCDYKQLKILLAFGRCGRSRPLLNADSTPLVVAEGRSRITISSFVSTVSRRDWRSQADK